MPLQSADRVVELTALVTGSAIVAGGVAGAAAGWMSKRSPILALCGGMVGIIGGLWIGSLMGLLFADPAKNGMIAACGRSLCPALAAGVAGALPTAVLVGGMITLLALRHVRQRPPPYWTGLKACACGLLAGLLAVIARLLI